MALTPATNRQVPEHSIMDFYNKQAYLGNQFQVSYSVTSGGSTEVNALYINNNSASGCPAQNGRALFISLKKLSSLIASNSAILRVYLNPTGVSGGTPVTPLNVRPAYPTVSVATVTSAPTATAGSSLLDTLCVAPLSSNSDHDLIVVDPGQSVLITLQASATSTPMNAIIGWYEI